jgi:cellobiose phosphorylase
LSCPSVSDRFNNWTGNAAWALLRHISMDTFAKTFPDYWAGQWTAPECFNSVVSGPLVGLPRTEVGGMFTSFPAYCAHAHAWPLYCYYRLRELEHTGDGH